MNIQKAKISQPFFVSLLLLLAFSVAACDKKAPEPKNQALEKGHGSPSLIHFTFSPGELSDISGIWGEGFTPQNGEKIIFKAEYNEKGELVLSDPITLKKGKWYELRIDFFNKANVLMNHEFLTPEQQLMHQFFFRSYVKKDNEDRMIQQKGVISYKYGDMENGKMLDLPIGFIGYLRIEPSVEAKSFEERVTLIHVTPPASKTDGNGKPYPFDSPATYLLGVTDVDIRIPIHIK